MTSNPPPRPLNSKGDPRRVGVEIEFGRVTARHAARIVRDCFGGTIREEDRHRFQVEDTALGDFICELDWSGAHAAKAAKEAAGGDVPFEALDTDALESKVREVLADISTAIVPSEVVSPPIEIEDLEKLDRLVAALRDAGAAGTLDSPVYAFGLHLNPEVPSTDPLYIHRMLTAYCLGSEWLRREIEIDPTRRILVHADAFPEKFVRQLCVMDPPDSLEDLIDVYLEDNPTRNRELDMLPFFTWAAPGRVEKTLEDPRIKARPTYHYRLPNAQIGDPDWHIVTEWNRWVAVERLAEDKADLMAMRDAYLAHREQWFPGEWAATAETWIKNK